MTPPNLQPEQFKGYPPQARQIAMARIGLLREMPLAFGALLLRELIAYDWKFPAERRELDRQFEYLNGLTPDQLHEEMAGFGNLRLSPELERVDWVDAPAQFSEKLTAHLWATHQMDEFRRISIAYVHKLDSALPREPIPISRLAVTIIGQGVTSNRYPLFRKLRPYGVYFNNVNPSNGKKVVFEAISARVKAHPVPFAHWYIDGNKNEEAFSGLTCISYESLKAVRSALLDKMRRMMQPGGEGPEALRTVMAQMRPDDLGLGGTGDDPVLSRFKVSILTEGSGTQIFSTTFVQWAAREALRRAQPLTLLTRYAPRQEEQSMEQLLAGSQHRPIPDEKGSLVDADMGAYYTWINQQRLVGAERSSFLVWFEEHSDALAIGPALARGTEDSRLIDMQALLARLS